MLFSDFKGKSINIIQLINITRMAFPTPSLPQLVWRLVDLLDSAHIILLWEAWNVIICVNAKKPQLLFPISKII